MSSTGTTSTILRTALGVLCLGSFAYAVTKTSQVAPNHMRWNNHDAMLTSAVAWQEERDKHWVTVVLVTDRPVPRESVAAGKTSGNLMEATKAQGIAFAVMSGGIPLPESGFEVGYHDGASIGTATQNGAGGFEIDSQSATQIKGRVLLHPFTAGDKDETAWSVSFDAPVLRGDAKRMAAEGDVLGAGAGAVGKDFLALQQAKLAMDFAALSAVASADLASFLKDAGQRAKNLTMLKGMTPPQSKILGGLQTADKARVYWAQQWPAALDSRCVETLVLQGGKWRSTESACQGE